MEPVNEVCKDCASWKVFKEKCWFFWDGKKECSQFKDDDFSEPKYKDAKRDPDSIIPDHINKRF